MRNVIRFLFVVAAVLSVGTLRLSAHCDSVDGPVVADARVALERGDVTPVLKWVQVNAEPEIREAFVRTMKVRAGGAEAAELADRWFFETLVRVHREGENAPYTGLKPAGTDVGMALRTGDEAVQSGSLDPVEALVLSRVREALHHRFGELREAAAHADESVDAGRRWVAAYTEFIHTVERFDRDATTSAVAHAHQDHP